MESIFPQIKQKALVKIEEGSFPINTFKDLSDSSLMLLFKIFFFLNEFVLLKS